MSLIFRLHHIIKSQLEEAGGNLSALYTKVRAASEHWDEHCKINPATLKKIVAKPDKVKLSLPNLVALQNYLGPKGLGLDVWPVLERTGLLHCLAETKNVSFLLGAKPNPGERRHDISGWDTRSMAVLLHDLCTLDVGIHYEIVDVLLTKEATLNSVKAQPWYALLQNTNQTLISIGSPKACLASEAILAGIFSVPPFVSPTLNYGEPGGLPVFHAWTRERGEHFTSHCAKSGQQLEAIREPWAQNVLKNQGSAFQVRGKWTYVPRESASGRWEVPATIIAQRRSHKQVWCVISGLSGPATYAAAELLKDIHMLEASLPPYTGPHSDVLCVPIKAVVETDRSVTKEGGADVRIVTAKEFDGDPIIWRLSQSRSTHQAGLAPNRGRAGGASSR